MHSTIVTTNPVPLGELLPSVAAEAGDSTETPIPEPVRARVAEAVAESWGTPPQDIRMQWGTIKDAAALADDIEFRLVGAGEDGWFAVVFEREGSPAFAARLRAGVTERVPVATRALEVGHVLTGTDVAYETMTRWRAPLALDRIGPVAPGWRIYAPVSAGDRLAPPAAGPQPVVQRGQRVKLTWRRSLVTVALEGVALHDAAPGYDLHVRLKGDRGTRRGIVTGPGQALLEA
jgi:flagella basal body P-ring formation protein FlgA